MYCLAPIPPRQEESQGKCRAGGDGAGWIGLAYVSPRRNRRPAPAPGPAPRPERTESGPDGEWTVRQVSGVATVKSYRCPGCDQEIVPGTPHVVAWNADQLIGVEGRRHWHTVCWDNRLRRRRR